MMLKVRNWLNEYERLEHFFIAQRTRHIGIMECASLHPGEFHRLSKEAMVELVETLREEHHASRIIMKEFAKAKALSPANNVSGTREQRESPKRQFRQATVQRRLAETDSGREAEMSLLEPSRQVDTPIRRPSRPSGCEVATGRESGPHHR